MSVLGRVVDFVAALTCWSRRPCESFGGWLWTFRRNFITIIIYSSTFWLEHPPTFTLSYYSRTTGYSYRQWVVSHKLNDLLIHRTLTQSTDQVPHDGRRWGSPSWVLTCLRCGLESQFRFRVGSKRAIGEGQDSKYLNGSGKNLT